MITLPDLLLAGPQLRRVVAGKDKTTKGEVWVWILFTKACKAQVLIYFGPQTDPSSNALFSPKVAAFATGDSTPTINLGANMYLALLCAQALFVPGQIYSYNVVVGGQVPAADLKSLGLLSKRPAKGVLPELPPLGYSEGTLPSFAFAPGLANLQLRHASCRKTSGYGVEALAVVDQDIEQNVSDPLKRPHQLFFTGDQIYADDVALPLAPLLSQLGAQLVNGTETPAEIMPLNLGNRGKGLYTIDQDNFPSGARQAFCDTIFSSGDAASHLMAFGEFAALYILSWSTFLWNSLSIPQTSTDFMTRFGGPHSTQPVATFGDVAKPADSDFKKASRALIEFVNGVPAVARTLANVPTFMIFDDHDVTDDWNRTKNWRKKAFAGDQQGGRAIVRNALLAYACFQDSGNDPASYLPGTSNIKQQLLTTVPQFTGVSLDDTTWRSAAATLDAQLGIGVAGIDPLVRWNYSLIPAGPEHDLYVLDTRTRRRYRSPKAAPVLIGSNDISSQLNSPSDRSSVLAIVVSAGNVISENSLKAIQDTLGLGDAATNFLDVESWDSDLGAPALLLTTLANRRLSIVLSGDVHHGFTSKINYYQMGRSCTLAQLVSSATKNWELGFAQQQASKSKKWYNSRASGLTMCWTRDVGAQGKLQLLAALLATRSVKGSATPPYTLAIAPSSWPQGFVFPQPDFYWVATPAVDGTVEISLRDAKADVVRSGITSMFMWRNNIGCISFDTSGGDPVVTHRLVTTASSTNPGSATSLTFVVPLVKDNDPLGYGW